MKKKNKKILIIISIIVLLLLIGITIFFILPIIKEKKEIKKLNNEVDSVIKEMDEGNIDKVSLIKKFDKNITTGDRLKVEKEIEAYLLELSDIKEKINDTLDNEKLENALNIESISDSDTLEYLSSLKEKIPGLVSEINEIKETRKDINIDSKKYKEEYNKLFEKINSKLSFDLTGTSEYIDKVTPIVEYMVSNKKYYEIKEDTIVFNKRSVKDKYDELVSTLECDRCNVVKSELIKDTEGPVITASNINITVGTSVDIKSKVKCVDKVDDTTTCNISGTYDKNKVGEYSIKISSEDKSGNKSSKTIKVIVSEKKATNTTVNSDKPYYIEVIRNQNVVIVYGKDENNKYTKIVKVFVCSVGRNNYTPVGTFKTSKGYTWGSLLGGVYGQYSTRITGSILFHSVPYYTKNKGDLEWEEYNKLGTAASAGCVRMAVRDVKWIYDNVASGTTVKIYDGSLPSGVSKPSAIKIPSDSPNRGWDPTDPDPNNPWKK